MRPYCQVLPSFHLTENFTKNYGREMIARSHKAMKKPRLNITDPQTDALICLNGIPRPISC